MVLIKHVCGINTVTRMKRQITELMLAIKEKNLTSGRSLCLYSILVFKDQCFLANSIEINTSLVVRDANINQTWDLINYLLCCNR